MLSASCVGLISAFMALLMTWMSAAKCCAQSHDPLATARSEMAHFAPPSTSGALREGMSLELAPGPRLELVQSAKKTPWVAIAASTSMALAATALVFEGLSYRASSQASRASGASKDLTLDLDARLRAQQQFGAAQDRATLMQRVSDICLAGTVAATGVTLLLWLSSKRRRSEQPVRTLLGPLVIHGGGASGGGMVMRSKF